MANDDHTEQNSPFVMFRAPNRSFKRIFKDRSLSETIESVRDKLRLRDETIKLAYLEGDITVDLEDEGDFEAFRATVVTARPNTTLHVLVTIGDPSHPVDREQHHRQQSEDTVRPKRKRKHRSADLSDAEEDTEEDQSRIAEPAEVLHRQHTASPPTEAPAEPPKKKRRKQKKDSKHAKSSEPVSQPSELADATPPASEPPADSPVAGPSTSKPKRRHKDIPQPSGTEPSPPKSSQDKSALRASNSEDDGEPAQTAEPGKARKRKRTLSQGSDVASREAAVLEEDEPDTGSAPVAGPSFSPSPPADRRPDKSGPSARLRAELAKQKKKKKHAVLDDEEGNRNAPMAAQPAPPEDSATGPPAKKLKKKVTIAVSPVQSEDEDGRPETSGNVREEPAKQKKAQTRRRVRTEESSTATARKETQVESNTESAEEVSSETEAAPASTSPAGVSANPEQQDSATKRRQKKKKQTEEEQPPAVLSAVQPPLAAKPNKPAKAKKTKAPVQESESQSQSEPEPETEPEPAPSPAAPVATPKGKSGRPAKKTKKQVAQQQQAADVEAAPPAPEPAVGEPSKRPARAKKTRAGQEGPKDDGAVHDVQVVEQAVASEEASAQNKPAKKTTRKKKAEGKQPETDPDPATAPTSTPAANAIPSPQDEPAAKQTKAKKARKVVFESSTAPVATASTSSPNVSRPKGSTAQPSSDVSEPRPTAEAASASQEAVETHLPASKAKGRKGKKNTPSTKPAEEKAARSPSDNDNMWADIFKIVDQKRASSSHAEVNKTPEVQPRVAKGKQGKSKLSTSRVPGDDPETTTVEPTVEQEVPSTRPAPPVPGSESRTPVAPTSGTTVEALPAKDPTLVIPLPRTTSFSSSRSAVESTGTTEAAASEDVHSPSGPQPHAELSQANVAAIDTETRSKPPSPGVSLAAGTKVTVQGQGESSSDESSSSDDESSNSDDEDEGDGEAEAGVKQSANVTASSVNMESAALLRGPVSRRSILDEIPSESSSEDENEDAHEEEEEEEEEMGLDKQKRRLSRSYIRAIFSSNEGVDANLNDEEEEVVPPSQDTTLKQGTVENPLNLDGISVREKPVSVREGKSPSAREGDKSQVNLAAGREGLEAQSSAEKNGKATFQKIYASQGSKLLGESPAQESDRVQNSSKSTSSADATIRIEQRNLDVLTEAASRNAEVPSSPSHDEREERLVAEALPAAEVRSADSGPSIKPPIQPDTDDVVGSITLVIPDPSQANIDIGDIILPADDLLEAVDHSMPDNVSIEQDAEESRPSTSSPYSSPRKGTLKRMKDRRGRTPKDSELPVLASENFEELAQSTPARAAKPDSSLPQSDSEPIAARIRKSARKAALTTRKSSLLTTPTPSAAKRRGRPPLSKEGKVRTKAEKEQAAAKKRIADEKIKEAEKAEKASPRQKASAAKKSVKGVKPASALKVVTNTADDDDKPSADDGSATPRPTIQDVQPPAWTTLTQGGDELTVEPESLLDELGSSSPARSASGTGPLPAKRLFAVEIVRSKASSQPVAKVADDHNASQSSQDTASDVHAASQESRDADEGDALFLPDNSQYQTQQNTQNLISAKGTMPTPFPSIDSDPDDGALTIMKRPAARSGLWNAKTQFRRLSDMTSQQLFRPLDSSRASSTPAVANKSGVTVQIEGDDESSSSSDESGSDSDTVTKSHIPQDRRAGAGVQKQKKSGLTSFTK
ncbi:uncharacterized protein LAESUDRAFT_816509 [Laetiporus sulphureus 93-53]|uniref:Uncharacterized protein n=1 Tax=Laetiporus sulphureus 93-53 TaxID=1314785 RepID=A0A165B882_9APHY|nr:uncharacterized protein LAESUDRAFT_816509 [Laetiporus sulphureus 93-53]KZT00471.1 hypothetical protein LAESUDRAFT_816509 [Laetiporus sulphureus 93-53]